ncbi:SAM hydrolase/SAM-dependent halogenase family protein [Candidatus Poriferisodalis sp.]|uniref:SAM hydrolase/SAM-dependent halogenase family protein n=1 Tax=Candidatus Poriferisodalis sp. TaxID=3101277 RepID=UPI003D0A7330
MSHFGTITCLSDLGNADESVGVIHSILRQAAPHALVIDLSHEIDPGDTRTAALMLARSVPYLAPGIVLASVGHRLVRPAIAVSVGDGQSMLVGPDNGVLAAATAAVGGADEAVLIGLDPASEAASALHPARDVLAPAAGRLAAGEPLSSLGAAVDPSLLLPALVAVPRIADDGMVIAEVLSVTRWGTVQINVDREILDGLGDLLVAEWAPTPQSDTSQAVRLMPPRQAGTSGLALADDPHGLLELTVAGGSAAHLGLDVGTEVRLRPAT